MRDENPPASKALAAGRQEAESIEEGVGEETQKQEARLTAMPQACAQEHHNGNNKAFNRWPKGPREFFHEGHQGHEAGQAGELAAAVVP